MGLIATLLDEIIEFATDNKQPLTVVLRKCLVLAHHLKNERLKAWADQELNGYPLNENLPQYRALSTYAVADYTGPFNSGVKNMPVPTHVLAEDQDSEHSAGNAREGSVALPLARPLERGSVNPNLGF